MIIAVVGCAHGELDQIYETIHAEQQRTGITIDLLIVGGDFQAVRNHADLKVMACPPKYRSLNTFYKYYSGEAKAPLLTLFVGGNHEASEYLLELPHGGWVAPNIYYIGIAGVVNYGGLRIAGLSGIYKKYSFNKGHYEKAPLSPDDVRSVYHMREYDVLRISQLKQPIDIFMSHDWPCGITRYGNEGSLISRKKHFRDEIQANSLGNPALWDILLQHRPKYWFSAHLHVKFPALVPWEMARSDEPIQKRAKIDVPTTKFLALDKVIPGRAFLQIIHVNDEPVMPDTRLQYDCEWLAILKNTMSLWPHTKHIPPHQFEGLKRGDFTPTPDSIESLRDKLTSRLGTLAIPLDFRRTAPAHGSKDVPQYHNGANYQTWSLMELLDDKPVPTKATMPTEEAEPARSRLVLPPPRSTLSLPPPKNG